MPALPDFPGSEASGSQAVERQEAMSHAGAAGLPGLRGFYARSPRRRAGTVFPQGRRGGLLRVRRSSGSLRTARDVR